MEKPGFTVLTEEQVKESIRQIDEMPILYANHSRIAPSFFDLRVFFGQLDVSPTGKQSVMEKLCVVLSPECAKLIADGLLKALGQYENLFGKLRTPPSLPTPAQSQETSTRKRKKAQ